MGCECSYKITILAQPEQDAEYLLYRFRKESDEAKTFLSEDGRSTGNEGPWRSIDDDMKRFTKNNPGVLLRIHETVYYDDKSEVRHYSKDGKYVELNPVITVVWPEFSEDELT